MCDVCFLACLTPHRWTETCSEKHSLSSPRMTFSRWEGQRAVSKAHFKNSRLYKERKDSGIMGIKILIWITWPRKSLWKWCLRSLAPECRDNGRKDPGGHLKLRDHRRLG